MREALERFLSELSAQRRASAHTVAAYRRDIARTLDLAAGPGRTARVARARARIDAEFTVRSMAAALGAIYTGVAETAGHP